MLFIHSWEGKALGKRVSVFAVMCDSAAKGDAKRIYLHLSAFRFCFSLVRYVCTVLSMEVVQF
jgi:hypothetical protein